ncbi:MAG: beta-galactosidase [Candidatus Aminicenantes bacterium]|nr:beta-galactosidase [Candidatus Aminicenantes bacterium]
MKLRRPRSRRFRLFLLSVALFIAVHAAAQIPSFRFEGPDFLLDGKPFQIMAGELHFQRIPKEYWNDRLIKARAMGLNTVATYVFWNALEPEPGQWNLTGNNDLAGFIRAAKEAGLYVVVRPGPYACAEWDFGGLPIWLLRTPDIKVRCMDSRFIAACDAYIKKLAEQIKPLLRANGGPVLMIQIENEYGSYGNDRQYVLALKRMWETAGISGPFCTADGATPYMLEAGSIPGAAIGLDPGTADKHYAEAAKLKRNVPVFCAEIYPGWLTHWGEKWASVKIEELLPDVQWLLDNKKSFSLYMFHGGTNFGFTAGANFSDRYQPDVTSYDYDAPLDEIGRPTPKYAALKELLGRAQPAGTQLPDLPPPLPAIEIPEIAFNQATSLFDNLPLPVSSPQPKAMEFTNQNSGFILYRTKLVGRHSGKLTLTELHDYANIYFDGRYIGTLDRTKKETTLEIPETDPPAQRLDILVEGMGRINYGQHMIDRKGITDRVTLNGMTLMDWDIFNLPMESRFLSSLKFVVGAPPETPGAFFRGSFDLQELGDTYVDMSLWKKGVLWVNGKNLGRYWEIGPQKRLFLPAPFLKKGKNDIIIFDLHQTRPAPVKGATSLKDDSEK